MDNKINLILSEVIITDEKTGLSKVKVSKELFDKIRQSSFAYTNKEKPTLMFVSKQNPDKTWVKIFSFNGKLVYVVTETVASPTQENPEGTKNITHSFVKTSDITPDMVVPEPDVEYSFTDILKKSNELYESSKKDAE